MIESINVRFFIVAEQDADGEEPEMSIFEVSEQCFVEQDGEIDYEHNTVFANGCNQICLTKRDNFNPVYTSELELIE